MALPNSQQVSLRDALEVVALLLAKFDPGMPFMDKSSNYLEN